MKYALLLSALCLLIHCTSSVPDSNRRDSGELDRAQAAAMAAKLANEECLRQFDNAPFDTASFALEFSDGRWRWGRLDVHGEKGYSARVSFDPDGGNDSVEVFFSTDLRKMGKGTREEAEETREQLEGSGE